MRYALILMAISLAGFSCGDAKKTRHLPPSKGEYGHIYVVVESSALTDKLRKSVNEVFGRLQPLYGQQEPYFEVDFLTPSLFKGRIRQDGTIIFIGKNSGDSELRTILPKQVDSVFTSFASRGKATFVLRDIWAGPQRLLFILDKDIDSLPSYISLNDHALLDKVLELEIQEAGGKLTSTYDEKISEHVLKHHNVSVQIPHTYRIARDERPSQGEGFLWLRKETDKTDLGILIHYEPYTDTTQFNLMKILARRDTVTRRWMPGELDSAYMAIDRQFEYDLKTIEFKGHYAREYYGQWTMINDFMGGPVYSITVYDEKHRRIVTLEGFVYAPKYEKTKYLRELQALIRKMEF